MPTETFEKAKSNLTPAIDCPHPAGAFQPYLEARDPVTGAWFQVGLCRDCGLHATIPQPTEEEIGRYYPPAYYGEGRRYLRPIEWLLYKLYDLRLARVVGGRAPGRVLDVGCGRGLLLARLRERGWQVHGTELSGGAAHYARDTLGLDIDTRPLKEIDYPDGHFDFIILWHVMEHLHKPGEMLAEIARILKPDGIFLLAVPNFDSWEARIGGPYWFHLNAPGHLSHYTPRTLQRELCRAGFRTLHRTFFSAEYDFFSFVQTVQNRVGLPPNLLFDLLRTRAARFGASANIVQKLAALALAIPLGILSLAYAPIAALLGKGATIQVVASNR